MTHLAAFQRWQAVCAIAVPCAALLFSPGAIAATQLFAVLSNGQPASIDPHTGAVTPIGPVLGGSDWDVVAAANTLYVQPSGGLASAFLDEVDVTSGQVTFVPHANIPPGVGISDLAVDPASGQLFAVLSNGQPASIDPHTGAVTPIGTVLGGSDWDVVAAANTLYVQPSGGLASAFLDEVDVTSGQVMFVPHANIPPGVGISDLAVDPASGQLFAVLSNGQPVSIDPQTGAVTPIGTGLGGSDWDVVAAANTLYVQPSGGLASAFLDEVDVTSGQVTFVPHANIPPGVGISDLTIAETGVSPVAEPTTAFLFLSSLAGLIGFGRRRRSDRAAPPNLP